MVLKTGIRCRFIILGQVIFLLNFGLVAFAHAGDEKSALARSIRQEVEQEALDEAMSAFTAGDYMKAKITFEILSESAQSAEIGRQAIFGLATVKLILAHTPEEYGDAVSSWKKWSDQVSSKIWFEDPRMLTPFLLRLQPPANAAEYLLQKKARRAPRDVEPRELLQTKEREMQSLRSKLDLREREIRRLRHQLESLEEIHRKYQEKKQEATP
ncbi:MAG: hypothetical protein ACLQBD_21410 [Syntrophobacteraceae bacterium]